MDGVSARNPAPELDCPHDGKILASPIKYALQFVQRFDVHQPDAAKQPELSAGSPARTDQRALFERTDFDVPIHPATVLWTFPASEVIDDGVAELERKFIGMTD